MGRLSLRRLGHDEAHKGFAMTKPTGDNDETKRRARWPFYLAMMLIVSPLLYVLSVGPAAVIAVRGGDRTNHVFSTCYGPLATVCDRSGTMAPLKKYINWWIEVTGSGP